jgi:hypothetical protein
MTESAPPMLPYQTPPGAGLYRPQRFRPLWGLGASLMTVIAAAMVASVLQSIFLFRQIDMLKLDKGGTPVPMSQARFNDVCVNGTGRAVLFLSLAGIVLWIVWFYNAYANLPLLAAAPTKHAKGWAIGGYFVPFLNLVRIPDMVSETWKSSDPNGSSGTALVLFWWLSWIITGMIVQAAQGMFTTTLGARPDLDSFIGGSWVFIMGNACRLLAGVLALVIVGGISSRQSRKWMLVERRS